MTLAEFVRLQHKAVTEGIDTPIYYSWAGQWFQTTIRGMYLLDDDQYCPDMLKADVNAISFYDVGGDVHSGGIRGTLKSTVKLPEWDGWVVDSDDSAIPLSMLTLSIDDFILDKITGDAVEIFPVIGTQRW